MAPIRVAVCDDSAEFRAVLVALLNGEAAMGSVTAYSSGRALLAGLANSPVDVVLLDVRMPGLDGPTTAAALRDLPDSPAVVYLTSYPDEVPLRDALGGSVAGALTKDAPLDCLIHAVQLAASGTSVINRTMIRRARAHGAPLRRDTFASNDAERDVLPLLCKGLSNEEIAGECHRALSSVKHTIAGMCRRAGVSSRTALVLYVLEVDAGT